MVFFHLPQSFFSRHIPFSIANIFYHCTMINEWTFAMDNKGFKNFLPMFFLLAKFCVFCPNILRKKIIGKICFWNGISINFPIFLLHYNFRKIPIAKKWNDGMHQKCLVLFSHSSRVWSFGPPTNIFSSHWWNFIPWQMHIKLDSPLACV
jgi:hypothetical protein